MSDVNTQAFIALFKQAYLKCFGYAMQQALSETESKLFYNQVFEQTGLVIGWKSLKNYSVYILNNSGKEENPSTATLDTMARYVLNAPYITETERKNKESHYPYWFKFKEQFAKQHSVETTIKKRSLKPVIIVLVLLAVAVIVVFLIVFYTSSARNFTDDFHNTNEDFMLKKGWQVIDKDENFWKRNNENKGLLTLFTLKGDNWHNSSEHPAIKNLLVRKISSDCFTAEMHLQDFFPAKEWQQAGILISEDTSFSGKSLRLSLAYNDFFGGFKKPNEVIIQGITSQGAQLARPEEIAHVQVFTLDSNNASLVKNNLQYSALRIEKNKDHYRLLYASGSTNNFAFKEAASADFAMKPAYIGIFALKGFVNDTATSAVKINYFAIAGNACK